MAQEGKPFPRRWKGQRQAREREVIRRRLEELRRELGSRRLLTCDEAEALLPGFTRRRMRRFVEYGLLVRAVVNHNHTRYTVESVEALAEALRCVSAVGEVAESGGVDLVRRLRILLESPESVE